MNLAPLFFSRRNGGNAWSGKEDSNLRPLPPENVAPDGTRRFSASFRGAHLSQNGVCSRMVLAGGSLRALGPCPRAPFPARITTEGDA
jgi:hypothetical protein